MVHTHAMDLSYAVAHRLALVLTLTMARSTAMVLNIRLARITLLDLKSSLAHVPFLGLNLTMARNSRVDLIRLPGSQFDTYLHLSKNACIIPLRIKGIKLKVYLDWDWISGIRSSNQYPFCQRT